MIFNVNNDHLEILDKKFSEIYFKEEHSGQSGIINLKKRPFNESFDEHHPLLMKSRLLSQSSLLDYDKINSTILEILHKATKMLLHIAFVDNHQNTDHYRLIETVDEIVDLSYQKFPVQFQISEKLWLLISEDIISDYGQHTHTATFISEIISFTLFLNLYWEGLFPLKNINVQKFNKWQTVIATKLSNVVIKNKFPTFIFNGDEAEILKLQTKLKNKNIQFDFANSTIKLHFLYCNQEEFFQKLLEAIS